MAEHAHHINFILLPPARTGDAEAASLVIDVHRREVGRRVCANLATCQVNSCQTSRTTAMSRSP